MPFDPYEYDKQMSKPAFDPYAYDKEHGTVTDPSVVAPSEPSFMDKIEAYGGAIARGGLHTLNSAIKFANENLPGPEDPDIIKTGLSELTKKAENLPKLSDIVPPEQQNFGEKFTEGVASVVPVLLAGPVGGATAVIAAYQNRFEEAKLKGLSSPSSFFHGLIGGAITAAMITTGGGGKTLTSTLGRSAVAGPGLAVAEPLAQRGLAELESNALNELAPNQEDPYEKYASEIGLKQIFDPTNIGIATALTFGFGVPHYVRANREANLANTVYQAAVKDGMAVKEPEKFSALEQQVGKAVAGRPQEADFLKLQAGEEVDLTGKQFGTKPSGEVPTEMSGVDKLDVESIRNNMSLVVDSAPLTEGESAVGKKPTRVRKTKKVAPEQVAKLEAMVREEQASEEPVPVEPQPESVTPVEAPIITEAPIEPVKVELPSVEPVVTQPTKSITAIDNVQNSHNQSVLDADSSMPYRLHVEGPEGSTPSSENVRTITIDPDIWAGEHMLTKLKADVPALLKKFPKATLSIVDSRAEGAPPVEILRTKSIGNKTLATIKKTFGATEDVQPRSERANVTVEEKVARLFLKDKNAVKKMAVENPEMLAKMQKDAGRKLGTVEKVQKGLPSATEPFKIQQDVWYKGFKDGDSVIHRDPTKVLRDLPGLKMEELVKGKMDGTNFVPNETKIISENEQNTLQAIFDLVTNERGSFSWEKKDKDRISLTFESIPKGIINGIKNAIDIKGRKSHLAASESITSAEMSTIPDRVWNNIPGLKEAIQRVSTRAQDISTNSEWQWKKDLYADGSYAQRQIEITKRSYLTTYIMDHFNILNNERGSFSTKDKVRASQEEIDRQKKVLTQLRQQYNYKKAYAESLGMDVKSYLKEQGMSDVEISQFSKLVNADRGFTNPQMGHYLRKALDKAMEDGFSDLDYKELKVKLTGIESMKDMNAGQQKKVLDVMQQLHFAEKGSEYAPKSKVGKKLVQADIENAILDQNMEWKNAWGLGTVLDRVISSAENYLGKWPAGSELVRLVKQRELNATLRSASIIKGFRSLTREVSPEEMRLAVHVHLKEATTTNTKVQTLAKFINDSLTPYGQEMELLGVKIANPLNGKLEAFKFDPETPYWPREYDWEDIQNPGRMRDLAVRKIAEKYKVSNAAALQKLNSIIRNVKKGPGSFGHLEISRIADLPNFNDNPAEVLPSYLYNAARRLEYIKEFGQDDVGLAEHLAKLEVQGGTAASTYAAAIVRRAFGTNEYVDPTTRNVINFANSAEVLMKLGLAQISNATQPVNTYMHTSLRTMYKGMSRLLNPMTRTEAVDFAHNAGSTFHTMVDAYSEYRRDPTTLVTWLRNTVPHGEKVFSEPGMAGNFLKYTGFTQVEIFNRVYTAIVGREYIKEQVTALRSATPGTRGERLAEVRLQKLGLDPTELRQRELTTDDLYQGSNALVEKTQFRNWAISLPKWTGDSAYSRLLTQFHSFAYHQTKMIKDLWLKEPERILPSILALSAAGLIAGSAKDLLKARERKWDSTSDTIKNLIYFLGQGGGFGMTADALQSAVRDKTGALTYGAGPVLGDISEYMYGVGQVFNGKPEILGGKILRDIPVVGPTIYNATKE